VIARFLAPDMAGLGAAQRATLTTILESLQESGYKPSAAERERLTTLLSEICKTPAEQLGIYDEICRWVRWHRLQGYWLALLFQDVMLRRPSLGLVSAVCLFAEAQLRHTFEDFGLHSYENAYSLLLMPEFADASADLTLRAGIVDILMSIHQSLTRTLQPLDYRNFNPLAEHPYTTFTWFDLREAFPSLSPGWPREPAPLIRALESCAPDDVYCRVLLRRFLGYVYMGLDAAAVEPEGPESAFIAQAIDQFRRGAEEAQAAGLDAEFGHAQRALGHALQAAGRLGEAVAALAAAYRHDEHELFTYWRALNARSAGDVVMAMAFAEGGPGTPDRARLDTANSFYRDGRTSTQIHLAMASVHPLVRAAKLQMSRSFNHNGFLAASLLGNPNDALAEIDADAPNEAIESMVELEAARISAGVSEFRNDRDVFYRHLTTAPGSAEAYIASISTEHEARARYLRTRLSAASLLAFAGDSGESAERVLEMKLPGVSMLFFLPSADKLGFVLLDAERDIFAPAWVRLSEPEMRALHERYDRELPPRDALAQGLGHEEARAALDHLLSGYEEKMGSLMEEILPLLTGRHLKIFPRMSMNTLPFHALHVGGRRLLEHCDVSYVQSIALFVRLHDARQGDSDKLMMVYGSGAPLYEGLIGGLSAEYGGRFRLLRQPDWAKFEEAAATAPSGDLFFACHGSYEPNNPMASRLEFGHPEGISFSTLFTRLEMPRFRSVIMGSCNSGLGRAEIPSEYIGLPNVFLCAGTRYVVGSLWRVNQLATVILLDQFFDGLSKGASPPLALNDAQRWLMSARNDQITDWIHSSLPRSAAPMAQAIRKRGPAPFSHPRDWAGFYVQGDV